MFFIDFSRFWKIVLLDAHLVGPELKLRVTVIVVAQISKIERFYRAYVQA